MNTPTIPADLFFSDRQDLTIDQLNATVEVIQEYVKGKPLHAWQHYPINQKILRQPVPVSELVEKYGLVEINRNPELIQKVTLVYDSYSAMSYLQVNDEEETTLELGQELEGWEQTNRVAFIFCLIQLDY